MNEHIQITPGAILFKNIPWSSELQQQLKTMLHLKDIFISSSWVTLWNMAMTPNRCYRMSAFEWTLKGCTPSGLTVRPSVLKIKYALHYMNMGDKLNIIDDANAFLFTIWFNKLRGIPWEEHWAFNKEPCTASYEMHVWMTWQFHEGWWSHILEGYCFNLRQVHDWLTILMGVGTMRTINERTILGTIQEIKF